MRRHKSLDKRGAGLLRDRVYAQPLRKDLSPDQQKYVHDAKPTRDLVEAIEQFKPTILIGVSTVKGTFTQKVIEAMTTLNERPIIFALSNPTDHAECTAEEAYKFSKGQAIFAAGVPFDSIESTLDPGIVDDLHNILRL